MKRNLKMFLKKRVVPGTLSAAMLFNMTANLPQQVFASIHSEDKTETVIEKFGHKYTLFDASATWEEANEYCQAQGGHLMTVTSSEEQEVLENLLKKGEKNNYWLGGQLSDDLNWKWITDEKFSYSNWSPNQPDNFTSCEDSLMVYRVPNPLDTAGPDLGKWNDLCHDGTCNGESFFGTDNFGFICEWDETDINPVAERDGHRYQIFDTSMYWTDAKAYCESLGGHLVTIVDEEEKNFVENFIAQNGKKKIYWYGATDEEEEGNWKWVTGENPSLRKNCSQRFRRKSSVKSQ